MSGVTSHFVLPATTSILPWIHGRRRIEFDQVRGSAPRRALGPKSQCFPVPTNSSLLDTGHRSFATPTPRLPLLLFSFFSVSYISGRGSQSSKRPADPSASSVPQVFTVSCLLGSVLTGGLGFSTNGSRLQRASLVSPVPSPKKHLRRTECRAPGEPVGRRHSLSVPHELLGNSEQLLECAVVLHSH